MSRCEINKVFEGSVADPLSLLCTLSASVQTLLNEITHSDKTAMADEIKHDRSQKVIHVVAGPQMLALPCCVV